MASGRGAAFGLGWSAATQIVGTFVKLASTLILTRLLAPDAYALLGTAMVVLTTLEWLSDVGVMPALVRHPHGGESEWLLVGWWIGLTRGLGLSAAAALAAMPLALFYRQPELTGVMLALALRPALMALRSPAMPRLRRDLEYRALFTDELTQVAIGTAAAIAVALFVPEAGAWALVAGTLAGALGGVVISYFLAPMGVRWYWDRDKAREIAGFGGRILLNTLVMAAWLNLDRLLGPRFLPLEAIGWYAIAWNLAAAAEGLVTRKTDVYFALLARKEDPIERSEWHHRTAGKAMIWAGPILALAAAAAPLGVRILYDSRYHPAGILLAILLARLIVRAAGQLDFQLLLAGGNVKAATVGYLVGAVVQAAILIPLISAFGVAGLAVSVLISTVVVTAAQAWAGPGLGRPAVKRMLAACAWAGAGVGLGMGLEWAIAM